VKRSDLRVERQGATVPKGDLAEYIEEVLRLLPEQHHDQARHDLRRLAVDRRSPRGKRAEARKHLALLEAILRDIAAFELFDQDTIIRQASRKREEISTLAPLASVDGRLAHKYEIFGLLEGWGLELTTKDTNPSKPSGPIIEAYRAAHVIAFGYETERETAYNYLKRYCAWRQTYQVAEANLKGEAN
jgi:hypothetical protein